MAESDGEEVPFETIVKGYEFEKDRYVVFTDDELEAALKAKSAGMIDVIQFVKSEEIDPIFYRSAYYLSPEKTGLKAYKILMKALTERGMVGLAQSRDPRSRVPGDIAPTATSS